MFQSNCITFLLLISLSRGSAVCNLCSDFKASVNSVNFTFLNKSLEGVYGNFTQLKVASFLHCLHACVREHCKCMSFNYKKTTGDTHICQLNAETKASKEMKLVDRKDFSYHEVIEVKREGTCGSASCVNSCCDTKPCQNGGLCQEICEEGIRRITCTCKTGYIGRFCEQVPSSLVIQPTPTSALIIGSTSVQ